jgi:hypothetical protein
MTQNRRPQIIPLPAGSWHLVETLEPCIFRPAPLSTTQATGQIYSFAGVSAPPESVTAVNFPGTPSSGFGCFTLAIAGRYWFYYAGTAGTQFPMILEPLAGREPPSADEDNSGFFYRRGTVNSGSGTTIATGVAVPLLGVNPRRKALNLCVPDSAASGILYLRYDGTDPTSTNHDFCVDLTTTRALQFTGPDVPKGGINALYVGPATTSILVTGSQWE